MKRISGLAASIVLLAASAASAQIAGVVTSQTIESTATEEPDIKGSLPGGGGAGQFYNVVNTDPLYALYNNYQVSTVTEPNYIAFANNGTLAGGSGTGSRLTTSTSIAVTFTNTTRAAITPTLESTILPGGFGFYVGNLDGNPTSVHSVAQDVNKTPESTTATLLTALFGYEETPVWNEGDVGFTFTITQGATILASYSGSAALNLLETCDPTCSAPYAVQTGAFTLSTPLNGFGLIASDSPDKAVGYAWDATPVSVGLGTIAAGASTTLTYTTTVSLSLKNSGYFSDQAPIAYAGFGDPIGKSAGAKGIADPNFPLLRYSLAPTYDPATNQLTDGAFLGYTAGGFPVTDSTVDADSSSMPPATLPIGAAALAPAGSPTPEPDTWALLVMGAGLLGLTVRRRRSSPRLA